MRKIIFNLFHLFIGVIIIPAFMILLFSGINYLLSIVFNLPYDDVQQSYTWILYAILIVLFVIFYLSDVIEYRDKNI